MGRKTEIDMEWVALINEALGAGISEKEIADFLKGNDSHREMDSRQVFAG